MTRNATFALVLACTASTVQATTFVVETTKAQQTIQHFGASDAWSMQNIGLWPEEDEQLKIADWLFSLETNDEGQPRGIGLSLWRFNLGAGSSEQGDSSYINKGTRTECLLRPDGTWDWTRQAGQRRFLQLARERGVPHMLAFLNSPPVQFTQNHLATNTGRGGTLNLRDDCYDSFAQFMAQAIKGIEQHDGVDIDYLCPVNEPDGHWNWLGPKQEGSPATNRETARLARATAQALQQQGLSTQVLVNESSDLRCLLGVYQTTWERGNTIRTLFSEDSAATYLGQTPHVPRLILGHSYWTNTPVDYMKKIRQELRDTCRKYGIGFWQSEICIMQNDEEIGGGGGYDFTMKTGLYVARIIHHDLCYANAESWSWWRACGGNYKDGLIRVFDRQHRSRDSRLLWCLGQYSRFVRPGAVRHEVTASRPEDPYGLMLSAYHNQDGSWVVVAINYSNEPQPLSLLLGGSNATTTWHPYRTSDDAGETLKPLPATNGQTTLKARSITTFVTKKL